VFENEGGGVCEGVCLLKKIYATFFGKREKEEINYAIERDSER